MHHLTLLVWCRHTREHPKYHINHIYSDENMYLLDIIAAKSVSFSSIFTRGSDNTSDGKKISVFHHDCLCDLLFLTKNACQCNLASGPAVMGTFTWNKAIQ